MKTFEIAENLKMRLFHNSGIELVLFAFCNEKRTKMR